MLQRIPTLDSAGLQIVSLHPIIQDYSELGHFGDRRGRNTTGWNISANSFQPLFQQFILIANLLCSPKNLRQIDAADADPEGLQKFFTIPRGIEGVRSSTDGTQPGPIHPVDDAANRNK